MTPFLFAYVITVDKFNRSIGLIIMYFIFVIMAILVWSSISKTFFSPATWTLEMAQFVMVGYYVLGGAYSIQLGSNVRMDLFYSKLTDYKKAQIDAFTVVFLIIYLCFLLFGGWESFTYSISYGGERSSSIWRPYIWPIKLVMLVGFFLMLLQSISEFFKDVLRIKGYKIGEKY